MTGAARDGLPGGPGPTGYCVLPVRGLPELLLAGAVELQDRDVLVVTSKAVSKVQGRLVAVPPGTSREEVRLAAVESETVRVVARRGPAGIAQTRPGLVLAAASVDASNVRPDEIALLPVAPDASAATLDALVPDPVVGPGKVSPVVPWDLAETRSARSHLHGRRH